MQISLCTLLAAALLTGVAQARVYSLQPVQTITFPEEGTAAPPKVAIDGSSAIILIDTAGRREARLFERDAAGHWNFVRTLLAAPLSSNPRGELEMSFGEAAILLDDVLHIYERNASGTWVESPTAGTPRGAGRISIYHHRIAVGRVGCNAGIDMFDRSRSSGVWRITGRVAASSEPCADDGTDFDQNYPLATAKVGNQLRVFNSFPNTLDWQRVATLTPPAGVSLGSTPPMQFGPTIVADGGAMFIQERSNDSSRWQYAGQLQLLDYANGTVALNPHSGESHVLTIAAPGDTRADARVDAYFNQVGTAPAGLQHVAAMYPPGSAASAHISNLFAVASSQERGGTRYVSFFELPRSLLDFTFTDDFESHNPSIWQQIPGSQFELANGGAAGNSVFRQSSLTGDAQAWLSGFDYREQHSIEADITPTAVAGADRWVGLAVRYLDANNHYYVTLRSSNVIQLRRKVAGAFVTLAQAPLPFSLNVRHHVKLIVNRDTLTVFVDGRQLLLARDAALDHGSVALLTHRARADFDNVYASPTVPFNVAYKDFTEVFDPGRPFSQSGGSWTPVEGPDGAVVGRAQTSTAGDVRAVIGASIDDQAVESRVRLDRYAASPQGAWFGLIARWRDSNTFYYLTVRSSNRLEIRKQVNGVISVLATVNFTATPGRFYDLKFTTLRDELHAYVDGVLVAQAQDGQIPDGQYGLGMYRAAATFQNFIVTQP